MDTIARFLTDYSGIILSCGALVLIGTWVFLAIDKFRNRHKKVDVAEKQKLTRSNAQVIVMLIALSLSCLVGLGLAGII